MILSRVRDGKHITPMTSTLPNGGKFDARTSTLCIGISFNHSRADEAVYDSTLVKLPADTLLALLYVYTPVTTDQPFGDPQSAVLKDAFMAAGALAKTGTYTEPNPFSQARSWTVRDCMQLEKCAELEVL